MSAPQPPSVAITQPRQPSPSAHSSLVCCTGPVVLSHVSVVVPSCSRLSCGDFWGSSLLLSDFFVCIPMLRWKVERWRIISLRTVLAMPKFGNLSAPSLEGESVFTGSLVEPSIAFRVMICLTAATLSAALGGFAHGFCPFLGLAHAGYALCCKFDTFSFWVLPQVCFVRLWQQDSCINVLLCACPDL